MTRRNDIKKDITYFGKTYELAHLQVGIAGLTIEQLTSKLLNAISMSTCFQLRVAGQQKRLGDKVMIEVAGESENR